MFAFTRPKIIGLATNVKIVSIASVAIFPFPATRDGPRLEDILGIFFGSRNHHLQEPAQDPPMPGRSSLLSRSARISLLRIRLPRQTSASVWHQTGRKLRQAPSNAGRTSISRWDQSVSLHPWTEIDGHTPTRGGSASVFRGNGAGGAAAGGGDPTIRALAWSALRTTTLYYIYIITRRTEILP